MPRSNAASRLSMSASPMWRTPSIFCAACASATSRTTRCASRTPPSSPRPRSRIATSPIVSCRTRPSIWSTKPPPRWPTKIYDLERQATNLEIEQAALKREKDPASRERLEAVQKEVAGVREKAKSLRARWQKERGAIGHIAELKTKIEELRFEAEDQTRSEEH